MNVIKKYRHWRYKRMTQRSWDKFLTGRLPLVCLENELWYARIYANGGRKWLKSMTAKEGLQKRRELIRDVHNALKEL